MSAYIQPARHWSQAAGVYPRTSQRPIASGPVTRYAITRVARIEDTTSILATSGQATPDQLRDPCPAVARPNEAGQYIHETAPGMYGPRRGQPSGWQSAPE